MRMLPFNFDQLESGDYFLSNLAGFHSYIDANTFNELIDTSKTSDIDINSQLESKLFIVQESQVTTAQNALCSALAKKLLQELEFRPIFMIVPTLRCDHTCTYCQVSRAAVNASGYDLDPDAIPAIIRTIKLLSDPPYKIEIQGGEPLLRLDLVKRIYDQAEIQLLPGNFELVIATSLSLLNNDTLNWAKTRNVFFSTSLDGQADIHNKSRILPSRDSFKRLKQSVENIKEVLDSDRIATVTTVTRKLLDDPESIIEAHLELGLDELFVRPISPYGFANSSPFSDYEIKEYMVFYRRLFDALVRLNQSGVRLVEGAAAIHLKRVLNPSFSQYADLKSPSGFLLNCVLFNYDAKVYGSDEARMLQRVIGDVDLSCGVADSVSLIKNQLYREVLSSSFNLVHPGCEACAYQPYCGTDPCQSISLMGEPVGDKSLSPFCQYHKSMFRFLLDRYHTHEPSRQVLKEWSRG